MSTIILGVDPGQTTGVFVMPSPWGGEHIAMQVRSEHAATAVIEFIATTVTGVGNRALIAVEAFVVGPRAARSRTPGAGKVAREIIAQLLFAVGTDVIERPAGVVKPWATDKRLDAAGLLAPTAGMRHARDACRQALYAAVHDGLMRDPLNARAGG